MSNSSFCFFLKLFLALVLINPGSQSILAELSLCSAKRSPCAVGSTCIVKAPGKTACICPEGKLFLSMNQPYGLDLINEILDQFFFAFLLTRR